MKTITVDKAVISFDCLKCWCKFDSDEYSIRKSDYGNSSKTYVAPPPRIKAFDNCPKCNKECSYMLK